MDEQASALAGRRIVLTRPAVGSLGARLADVGAVVEHVPLIEIGPPTDGGAALEEALAALDSFDWLVVTSANGAAQVGAAAARCPDVRLAAVGNATAAALEGLAARSVDVLPSVATTEGLLAEFPTSPGRVLIARGNLAGGRLADGLRSIGHDVVAVEAYSTTLRPPAADDVEVLCSADAVVLASGSAVESMAAQGQDVAGAVVTIGPKTAAVARAHGLTVAAVAAAPTDDAVVAALLNALS